ncbi:Bleomycin resistance protein [Flavobacterium longum]|uniref:VOC family protein n=1 Tax=Flavobacterium longum TaxID=1299340 RepID=UPI0039EC7707
MAKLLKTIPAFPVTRIDEAVDFYKAKLNFDCRHKEATFAILVRDEIELHLWASCNHSWKWKSIFLFLKPISSGAESFLAGTHSCRIEIKGVDELFDELKATGVLHSEKSAIEDTYWGTREFHTVDLHGNLITFYENLE